MTVTVTDGRSKRRGRRLASDRGSLSVTVLMVPFIVMASMLVVQYGLAFYARQVVAGATQDGAAVAALDGSSPGQGKAVTDSLVAASGGHLIDGYSSSVTTTGSTITITAEAQVVGLLPIFPTITVRGASSATFERFRVPGR